MSMNVKKSPNKRSMTVDLNSQRIFPLLVAVTLPKIGVSSSQTLTSGVRDGPARAVKSKFAVHRTTSNLLKDSQLDRDYNVEGDTKDKLKVSKLKNKSTVNVLHNARSNVIPFGGAGTRNGAKVETNRTSFNTRPSLFSNRSSAFDFPRPILVPERIQRYFIAQGVPFDSSKLTDTSVAMLLSGKLELAAVAEETALDSLKEDRFFKLASESNGAVVKAIITRIKTIIEKSEECSESALLTKLKEDIEKARLKKDNVYLLTAFACIKQLLAEFEVPKERVKLLMKAFYRLFEENNGCWKRLFSVLADSIGNLEARVSTIESALKSEFDEHEGLNASLLTEEQRKVLARMKEERRRLEERVKELEKDASVWMIQWEKIKASDRIVNKLETLTETAVEKICDLDEKMEEDKRALRLNIERLIHAYPGDFLSDKHNNNEREAAREKLDGAIASTKEKAESSKLLVVSRLLQRKSASIGIQAEVFKSAREKELESFARNGSRVELSGDCRTALNVWWQRRRRVKGVVQKIRRWCCKNRMYSGTSTCSTPSSCITGKWRMMCFRCQWTCVSWSTLCTTSLPATKPRT
eukprot:TRINITY_DN10605_c0_g1_i7.p1 TRINITY_DN10605_c0_g1~~TRINITY_DN10605_c0_g1_i7.p1  ORF type:complete len:582 (+),score=76.71 TRINITY_DN10605_c0_g1_i7:202-1947(+)